MELVVKKDLLSVLSDVIEVLRKKEEKDILELKELSNHTIHDASIYQDQDSISMAVITSSIYNIVKRYGMVPDVYSKSMALFKQAREFLERNDFGSYRKSIKTLFSLISNLDKRFMEYLEDVITRAKIRKGGRLYEHGISMARAAEILGLSQWELMSYVGKTGISEKEKLRDVKKRLRFARNLFGKL